MVKPKYELVKVAKKIYCLIVPDQYTRAMLFCRIQEFYESPSKKFRGKPFSIWNYFEWYAARGLKCFTYPKDFTGFNIPVDIGFECYRLASVETPYDEIMKPLISKLHSKGKGSYLIGAPSDSCSTFDHELAHAFYATVSGYKTKMDAITADLRKSQLTQFKSNLKRLGYCSDVMKDEIQAYMATEVNEVICAGVDKPKKLHKRYSTIFNDTKSKVYG